MALAGAASCGGDDDGDGEADGGAKAPAAGTGAEDESVRRADFAACVTKGGFNASELPDGQENVITPDEGLDVIQFDVTKRGEPFPSVRAYFFPDADQAKKGARVLDENAAGPVEPARKGSVVLHYTGDPERAASEPVVARCLG